MPTLSDLVDLLHGWYPPETASEGDAVGLVAGEPEAEVRRVMFAVDPVQPVAAEAAEWDADLLVVHHPLFLTAVHGVAATTPKGRTLHTLTKAGCEKITSSTSIEETFSPPVMITSFLRSEIVR